MRYGDNLWLAEAKGAEAAARSIREELNLPNLLENIAPTRERQAHARKHQDCH